MIPKELFRQLRKIEFVTKRLANDELSGSYTSVFKGQGLAFREVRQYLPGDDVRKIDWNVTARMNDPFVKVFVEERELTVMLLLDMSASSYFGTSVQLKMQLAAKICSLLAFSAIKNNDRVGFIAFTDRIEKFIPPRKGLRHVLRVIRETLYFKPQGSGTDINVALEYLNRVMTRKSVVFIISDFFAPDFKKRLAVTNKRHDVVAVTITDPRELELPDAGLVKLFDPEKKRDFVLDTSDKALRLEYAQKNEKRARERSRLFSSVSVDAIDVRTDVPYAKSLMKFFKTRERRMR